MFECTTYLYLMHILMSHGEGKYFQGLNLPTKDLKLIPTLSLTRKALPTQNRHQKPCQPLSILVFNHTTQLDKKE